METQYGSRRSDYVIARPFEDRNLRGKGIEKFKSDDTALRGLIIGISIQLNLIYGPSIGQTTRYHSSHIQTDRLSFPPSPILPHILL